MGMLLRGFVCCKGAVTADIEIQRVIHTVPHTHDPSPDSVAASRLKKCYIAEYANPDTRGYYDTRYN